MWARLCARLLRYSCFTSSSSPESSSESPELDDMENVRPSILLGILFGGACPATKSGISMPACDDDEGAPCPFKSSSSILPLALHNSTNKTFIPSFKHLFLLSPVHPPLLSWWIPCATHLTRGDIAIANCLLALKAKIRKDFAFKIEIRKSRRRETVGRRANAYCRRQGRGRDRSEAADRRHLRGYGRSGGWRRIWGRDPVARYRYPTTVSSPVSSLAIALEHALGAHWGRPETPRGLFRTA